MAQKGRTWVWILGGFFFFFFVLALVGWLFLPRWINSQDLKGQISSKIEASSGFHAEIENLEVVNFSPLRIRARGLRLVGEEKGEIVFAPQVWATISILHLLRGEIRISSLELEGLVVRGDRLLGRGHSELGSSAPFLGASSLRVKDATFVLGQLGKENVSVRRVELDAESLNSGSLAFKVKGALFLGESQGFSLGALGSIDPDGRARLVLDAESVSLERVLSLLDREVPPPLVSGNADIHLRVNGIPENQLDWEATARIREFQVDWPGMLEMPFRSLLATLLARGSWSPKDFRVDDLDWKDERFEIKGRLLLDGQGAIEGRVEGGPFQLHDVIPYLGKDLIGPALQGFFREDVLGGRARGVTFTFSRKKVDSSGDHSFLIMEMPFEGASLRFDPNLPPLEELSGTLVWQGDKVWFKDVLGKYKGHPFERVETKITDVGKTSTLEGLFSLELGWPDIGELLRAVQGPSTKRGFLDSLEGTCALQLSLKKAFLKKEPLYYDGAIQVREAKGRPLMEKFPWRAQSGSVKVNPREISVEKIEGTVGGSKWLVRAQAKNWSSDSISAMVHLSISASTEDLVEFLKDALGDLRLDGELPVPLEVSLEGRGKEFRGTLGADLSNARVSFGEVWEKAQGEDFRVDASFMGLPGEQLTLEAARILDQGNEILVSRKEERWLLEAKEFPATLLGKRVKALGGSLKKGTVGIKAQFRPHEPLKFELVANPKAVEISPSPIKREFLVSSGSLVLTPEGLTADTVEMEIGGTRVSFAGKVESAPGGRIRIKGGLRGEHLDLDNLLKPPEDHEPPSSDGGFQRLLHKTMDSQLSLAFRKLTFMGFSFEAVQATLEKREGGLLLKDFIGNLSHGEVHIEGQIASAQQWEMRGKLQGARSSEFLAAIGMQETLIEGELGIQGKVERKLGEGGSAETRGELSLEIQKGLIRKFPILASILSMMNLSQLLSGKVPQFSHQGMVFEKIVGTFDLKGSKLHTNDFTVQSEAMVVTMEGEIDLGSRQCDMKVGVRPFVGFDRFVTKIPVIRHYLAGRERTVFATYFTVKGDLSSPQVTAMPLESLGNAFVGIFKRLFQNPFWDMGPPAEKVEEPVEVEHSR